MSFSTHPMLAEKLLLKERQQQLMRSRRGPPPSFGARFCGFLANLSVALGIVLLLIQLLSASEIFKVDVTVHSGTRLVPMKDMIASPWQAMSFRESEPDLSDPDREFLTFHDDEAVQGEAAVEASEELDAPGVRGETDKEEGEEGMNQGKSLSTDDDSLEPHTGFTFDLSDEHLNKLVVSSTRSHSKGKMPNQAQLDTATEAEEMLEDIVFQREDEVNGDSESPWFSTGSERPPVDGSFNGTDVVFPASITLSRQPAIKAYNSGQNFWPWYKILSRKHHWTWAAESVPNSRATLLLSKGTVPYLKRGKQMLNSIGVSGCIGGSKSLQLSCRERLATHFGCSYDHLGIQPMQYSVQDPETCRAWYRAASTPGLEGKMWMWKPSNNFHGSGLRVFKGPEEIYHSLLRECQSSKDAVVMEYVAQPATMKGGYKFDLRTYLLVGSLNPQLVFFADGFIRKSDKKYSTEDTRTTVHVTNSVQQSTTDHFFSFDEMSSELESEMKFPPGYVDEMRSYMKNVSLFVFKSTDVQNKPLSRFPGRFHLFAIDWLIGADGKVHLLEGNGYPLVTEYPVKGLTPDIWNDLISLVVQIHTSPASLGTKMTVKDNFTHGKWSLLYNELEEDWNAKTNKDNVYNPCKVFPSNIVLSEF